VTKEELMKLFEPIGKVNEMKIKDKNGTNFFAFVEYDDIRDAETALMK
jgi:RNA recognition motif-containing protein